MKRIAFLHKLHKEEKIKLVEPSDEISLAYLQKSSKSLSSSKTLLEVGNLEDSVALAYYAMYHCLLALFFKIGLKCENHSAAIIFLQKLFNKDNSSISKAKSERVDKQYYVDFSVSKEETNEAITSAEDFIAEINDFISKLNNKDIENYRNNTKEIVGMK